MWYVNYKHVAAKGFHLIYLPNVKEYMKQLHFDIEGACVKLLYCEIYDSA